MRNRNIFYAMTIMILISFVYADLALAEEWSRETEMPISRSLFSVGVVNGVIYLIGGLGGTSIEAYDPGTNTWTKKFDMPISQSSRLGISANVVNGLIYVIGGSYGFGNALPDVNVYDPGTNTWTKKTNMPTPRIFHTASVFNGIIYTIGGRADGVFGSSVAIVEAYNPATNTWEKKADMPTARDLFASDVLDGIIYAVGGDGNTNHAEVEAYNPITDTWTKKADLPSIRFGMSVNALNGLIYAIGGFPSVIEVYDPITDTWTKMPDMPTARGYHSACIVNGRIYVIGGSMDSNSGSALPKGVIEEYDPMRAPKRPLSVDLKDKLTTLWGEVKTKD